MHSSEEWYRHAAVNVSQASTQRASASRQCAQSRKAHDDTVTNNLSMYDELYKSLAQKVSSSSRLVEKLQRRAASVESAIGQQKNSLHMLDRALQEKDAPLRLCMRRMEQRERRPLREQVRDLVEASLDEEKLTLVDQQRRLGEAIRRTRASMLELEHNLTELRRDIAQKTQALSVDEMCLKTTQRSYQSMAEQRTLSPSGGPSRRPGGVKQARHQVALQESSNNELTRHQETAQMDKDASSREEAARLLREENGKLVARAEKAAEEAAAASERRIRERVASLQAVQTRLAAEIRETLSKIEHTKATISETKYQIKSLQEPMDLTATCASWRQQRATREQFADPVTTKLQEHRVTVLQSHQELVGHRQQEKAQLHDLEDRRGRLEEDLREKTASLQIDLACLATRRPTTAGGGKSRVRPQTGKVRSPSGAPPMPPMPHSARCLSRG